MIFQGDQGYCYIPYNYVANPEYCFDVWTIRKVETDDFGQDHLDQNDSIDYRQNANSGGGDDDDDDNNNPTIEEAHVDEEDDNY